MIKDIKFNGYTTAPSDYECPDGALAASINVISEEQHLLPLMQPKLLMTLNDNCNVIGIHKTSAYEHYIIYNGAEMKLYWVNSTATEMATDDNHTIGYYNKIGHINYVGNTLMVFTESEIIYILWKEGKYSKLGNHLPNIEISFGLKGRPRFYSISDESKSTFNITFNGIASGELFNTWTEENKTKITSQIMAKVNKFLREQTVSKGRFALPFMVRYALRMYDGSTVCHSAPILMNPCTKAAPIVYWTRARGKSSYTEATCDIMLVASSLDYRLINDAEYDSTSLKNDWSDIIKSVDVFISAPIYTYDQDGQCSSFNDTDNFDQKFIGTLAIDAFSTTPKEDCALLPITIEKGDSTIMNTTTDPSTTDLCKIYSEWEYSRLYSLYKSQDRTYPSTTINLPEFSADKVRETISNVSNFYLLTSIKLEELTSSKRTDIVIDDDYLQSLVNREVMKDDYLTHDRLMAQFSHGYNGRINLAGIKRDPFRGFYASSMFSYCNNEIVTSSVSNTTITVKFPLWGNSSINISVYIKENGETYRVDSNDNSYLSYFLSTTLYNSNEDAQAGTNGYLAKRSWGCFVFYPNTNAFMMVIRDIRGKYVIDLKAHDFLNGAYALLDYELPREISTAKEPNVTYNSYGMNYIDMPNKIYTSEVNNPFYFPVLGINTVGTGTILGISSATKALSQGQFGQFPLYAFTSEGVWALEVSTTGGYKAKQPVTRDVCKNNNSITQLDSAVLFATDRGIMLLSGSKTSCITDTINAEQPFNVLSLPHMDKLHTMIGHSADTCFPTAPFLQFVQDCEMIYDYVHQHIVVFNSKYTYAYVYSLKSKDWGMMFSNISKGVNSYPDALAMTNDNKLVTFSDTDETEAKGLYVTRPLKLETPDVLKTIDAVIQRGYFKKGDVQTVLYGSRDLFNWFLVWSSKDHLLTGFRGTPYKYLRIAGIASLSQDKSVFGASVQFTPKLTNQPR